jgi:hypothetical protein
MADFLRIAPIAAALCFAAAALSLSAVSAPLQEDPTTCTSTELRGLVTSFVRAFNRGESDVLDHLFAREPDFQWYSTGAPGVRVGLAARDRSSLLRYFAKRHARDERLTLRRYRFMGNTETPSLKRYGNFVLRLTRRASDLRPTPYQGKGAAHCYADDDVIIVWSMATARQ